MKKIAVILSIYRKDNLSCVKESLDSLFTQTFSSTDVFIQLDGDIDNEVRGYLSNLSEKDIFIFERTQNKGLACSLNDLLKIVLPMGYQYIARMDADDISMPERFEKQIAYMENHPDIDCLGTWAIEIDDGGNEYFRKRMPLTNEECLDFFRMRDCMIHPTVMFRRSYFEKAGLYPVDTYFGEDTMMWAKGFQAGCKFANLPEYLLKFRLDIDFFQRRRGWKHAKSIFTLRRRINEMLGFGLKEDCYALMYAIAKLMPTQILDLIYRKMR
ncbi:glycosyltransferase [uncultured Bacteroides sp.]|uniref:glycosyltransferase n=1 Tax=uncultured Bacteroides sp. TaxID=162156 RepID=UPI0025F228BD|nr:glycosyltransferase [uncultured Bacteroides sp.]